MTSAIPTTSNSTELSVSFDIEVGLHFFSGPPEGISARIRRVMAGLVEVCSPVYFPHNQQLQIVCDKRRIESRVAYCRRIVSGTYDLAVRLGSDTYMRSDARIPVDLNTSLHVLGSPAPTAVKVLDLSPSGLGLELPVRIPVGSRVSVSLGYSTAIGEIRHCAPTGQNYRAGIRLEKLIRRSDAYARVWTDLNSGSGNTAALAAFARAVEERQSRSEATLLSFGGTRGTGA
jgi:hypothetical protein